MDRLDEVEGAAIGAPSRDDLSVRTINALNRAGIGIHEAGARGYERIARLKGMGPGSLREIFPEVFASKSRMLTADEISLAREWFNALCDTNPKMIEERDRRLGDKLAAWALTPHPAPRSAETSRATGLKTT